MDDLRRELNVLAGLSAAPATSFSPVQAQKFFFLCDKEQAAALGGELFNFDAYDYGPFDREVYRMLEKLEHDGYVRIVNPESRYRRYQLTDEGFERGRRQLAKLNGELQGWLEQTSRWVQSLSFGQLVEAIYNKYPQMKKNSVYRFAQG
ncbi:hypothetical protein [Roseiterribacter gracilis]|uniref:Uncharacterized protein n=1 Tax=Roseiterribacter gracilis TaxID=2812848 RepID=A0A8S8XB35_9PROT|nr:hypothetical protein TMPK1_29200 [Rhodospirillales bacterium TMPK1]